MEIGEKIGLKKGLGLGILGTLTVVGAIKVAFDFRRKKTERISELQELQQVDKELEVEATEHESAEQADQQSLSEHESPN